MDLSHGKCHASPLGAAPNSDTSLSLTSSEATRPDCRFFTSLMPTMSNVTDDGRSQLSPLRNPRENMSSYFNRSASAVQTYADRCVVVEFAIGCAPTIHGHTRFEHEYARPALHVSQALFDEHPVAAVWRTHSSMFQFFH